jgi:Holliday junction resolvase-like predicted endonuclease
MRNTSTRSRSGYSKKIGVLGESLACSFLRSKGHKIIARNYCKPWGEIDIITKKGAVYHFVEVKSVSREIITGKENSVSRITMSGEYTPEQNLHPWKLKRIERAIASYLADIVGDNHEWQIDAVTCLIDTKSRKSKITLFENVL